MEIFKKYKNILIIVILAVAGFVVYTIFFAGSGVSSNSLLGSTNQKDESIAIGREFLSVLQELKTLNLDRSLFENELFLVLRDFSQEVAPQPSGRPNPFLPIGIDIVTPNDTSSSFDFTNPDTGPDEGGGNTGNTESL